ncbi:hypothetical protein PFFVO_02127 [Plasmodium falciparum Vietnam Oak-Knoll (FVO)]|uniref:Serine aminopeptidase S33 domain-containing protein n=1 Tax=Plasmodium falciparum Vietnam Oak-Knoll (FVO) TaxID=1036723 RepID=A0A024V8W1_PLAFA|nr:hypothetical protein PFFVO_02127 [Plasmodium falciparum Vietnam Oak-Knoll (FVO)]
MRIIKYIFFAFIILALFICALNTYIYLKQDSFVFSNEFPTVEEKNQTLGENYEIISGLIVQNAFTSLKELSKYSHPFLNYFLFDYDMIIRSKMDNESKIKNITVPTLFTLSEMDEKVPTSHTRTLFQLSASANKQLYLSKGGTHPNILKNDDGSYHKAMKNFIDTAISIREKNIQKAVERNPNTPN